jgi:hypothetical protein
MTMRAKEQSLCGQVVQTIGVRDRSDDDTLVITQSLLAEMLGVHRLTINECDPEVGTRRALSGALQRLHGEALSRATGEPVTKASLQADGLFAKAKRRGAHRKKRERRPLPEMLLFQDGSARRWVAGLGRDLDLVVTLDDATSAIAGILPRKGTNPGYLA